MVANDKGMYLVYLKENDNMKIANKIPHRKVSPRKTTKITKFVPSAASTTSSTQNTFVQAMRVQSNFTHTENGALTNKSTLNDVLDLFAAAGALRQRSQTDIINIFSKAFAQDPLLATKILFYIRDVRQGQGERNTFRTILNWLANYNSDVISKNIENVPFYGRFDDLYSLIGTSLEGNVFAFFEKQLTQDLKNMKKGESVSLLAKWLASENTSSQKTRILAHKTRRALDLSPKKYRKILSSLRKYIDVLEVKMCSNEWNDINFEKVPSKASLNYRKAFGRHDQDRYAAYLKSVEKGEAKINAGAIFPYEIFRSIIHGGSAQELLQADLQWKAMPNWLEGNEHYGLVIADVSGSMTCNNCLPLLVSVSLALYFAERNIGPFKDMWLNFSTNPSFQKFVGNNIYEKYKNMDTNNWCQSTNLQSAFDLILNVAVKNKVPQKDMPSCLYIVSDMEFNDCGNVTNSDLMKQKFARAGYELPRIVWWNVNAKNDNFPIRTDEKGMALVSGASPSILKSLLSAKSFDPMSIVYDTVNTPRYDKIKI